MAVSYTHTCIHTGIQSQIYTAVNRYLWQRLLKDLRLHVLNMLQKKLIIKRDGEECGRREEHWTEAIISLVMTIKSHPKC